jgi:predicted AAA+ superfamily ATPase
MKPQPLYMKIWRELAAKKPMVFMAGLRQTGKTTLAQIVSEEYIDCCPTMISRY